MTSSMLLPIRPASPQARREVRRDTPLRRARTCYGHLAGVAGVELLEEMLARGWLETPAVAPDARRLQYGPTAAGRAVFAASGCALPQARGGKPIAFSCIDWTERRPHLGGPLGRAAVAALADAGCLTRTQGSRAVILSQEISRCLDAWASLVAGPGTYAGPGSGAPLPDPPRGPNVNPSLASAALAQLDALMALR